MRVGPLHPSLILFAKIALPVRASSSRLSSRRDLMTRRDGRGL
jgi:hypothetical protein